jgi:hypothetical protein
VLIVSFGPASKKTFGEIGLVSLCEPSLKRGCAAYLQNRLQIRR